MIHTWDDSVLRVVQHPRVPYDVLTDPESVGDVAGETALPLEERKTFYEVVMQDKGLDEDELRSVPLLPAQGPQGAWRVWQGAGARGDQGLCRDGRADRH